MDIFAVFAPKLVGSVLAGSVDPTQGVCLHLFTDNPDDVVFMLLDRGVPWQREQEGLSLRG